MALLEIALQPLVEVQVVQTVHDNLQSVAAALAALMVVAAAALTPVAEFIVAARAALAQFGLFGPAIPVHSHQLVQATFN
jgi:hypothetical protein